MKSETANSGQNGARQRSGAGVRKTRAEKTQETRRALMRAAARVVGRYGYAEASVARITSKAKVAQGTFYNYFESRQELFDQLLPEVGGEMLSFIRERVESDATGVKREEQRLRAYFEFLRENPEFYRILNEAEIFAPTAHKRHFQLLKEGYVAALKRSDERGELGDFEDDEMEVLAYMLMAARSYLSLGYAYKNGKAVAVPEHVIKAYAKFVGWGLFGKAREVVEPVRDGRR